MDYAVYGTPPRTGAVNRESHRRSIGGVRNRRHDLPAHFLDRQDGPDNSSKAIVRRRVGKARAPGLPARQ